MEAAIAALCIIGFLVFAFVLGRKQDDTQQRSKPATEEPLPPTRTPGLRSKQRPVFDSTTASSTTKAQVLTGPAYVVDGDTIKIRKTQIRLFGVDAPELNHPYGQKAKWAMVKLCKGHNVRAEITEKDDYGRTVARCFLPDGRDLSAELVKQGLAIDWPKYSGGVYRNFETIDARKKLWLADARQKGRMDVWEEYEDKCRKRT
ncbi:thermonuclease family protein [uncultured Roseobacter sp.]|uniref:thermonuclease family protein n=1 Tax=uncultured Roseobacter sp. TaxID=114847 RepID=UPI0026075FF0|nr:thermonuclease family protein [uncultured Roseobacter sp.]